MGRYSVSPTLKFRAGLRATGILCGALVLLGGVVSPSGAEPNTANPPSAGDGSSAGVSQPPSPLPSVPTIDTPRGDSIRARQFWLTEYNLSEVWKQATGKDVTVAVIDTGVDGNHQDLQGNVLQGYDASGVGSSNGWQGLGIEPEHGTLVASLIAGHGHDDGSSTGNTDWPGEPAGVLGIAPDAKILPISLEIGVSLGKSIDEQLPEAVKYAVDHGADIINLSVGSNNTSWPASWDDAFTYAEEKGVLLVASAGNRGSGITQVGAPATMPGVLTVGGINQQGEVSEESSSEGISLAVVAPSEQLISAMPDNRYALWSGTSAAAPLVSGTAALLKEKYPDLTANQLIQRIISSADDRGVSGRDASFGYGIINPQRALAPETSQDATSNPLGSMADWVHVHRKAELGAAVEPDPATSTAPVHEASDQLREVSAPTPTRPVEDSGILPFIVLGGFALWTLIITGGTVARLRRINPRWR